MLHYIDIHLRPDPEFASHLLMAALYAKLHRRLVQVQNQRVAVSFPGYQQTPATLGRTLRLIGPGADLARMMDGNWLQGMQDHVQTQPLMEVPSNALPRALRRVQAKSNPERLRRRQMRRHQLTVEQALERVPDGCAEVLKLPFVTLSSASTGQKFNLFLRLDPPSPAAQPGDFNGYGLSATATVPWF